MKNTKLLLIVILAALVVGVAGAYVASRTFSSRWTDAKGYYFDRSPERMGFYGNALLDGSACLNGTEYGGRTSRSPMQRGQMGPGMMGGRGWYQNDPTLERISIDEAAEFAEAYISQIDADLKVVEVMEFTQNFYAVVVEKDTEMGAMELLIDPQTGSVSPEIGPNHMWNAKYGRMNWQLDETVSNTVSMQEAVIAAQSALDECITGAEVDSHGIEFYGYYSFDYSVDGEIAGMLSVNGSDGRVWFHTWHGEFIGEKEIE